MYLSHHVVKRAQDTWGKKKRLWWPKEFITMIQLLLTTTTTTTTYYCCFLLSPVSLSLVSHNSLDRSLSRASGEGVIDDVFPLASAA